MVTLRHLRYFEALSRHRHFSRAAEECSVTQPALSVQIQELETSLRVPLIERRRGQIELTAIGIEIARRASKILLAVRDLKDYALAAEGVVGGPFSLGVIPTIAPYLLAEVLPALRENFPELDMTIFEAQTGRLLEDVLAGKLDAVLISLPVEKQGLEVMPLFDDAFVLAVGRESPFASQTIVDHESLAEANLLLLDEGHCLRDQALSYCHIAPAGIRQKFGAAGLGTIIQLVANGYGVTFLPEMAVPVKMSNDERIVFRRFAGQQPRRTIGLVWRETSPRREEFRVLGEVIAETGEQIIDRCRQMLPLPVEKAVIQREMV